MSLNDRRQAGQQAQRGIALMVVLWACTLLAILLGGFATLARTEALQTRHLSGRVQLRYLAEAGAMRAIAECTGKNGGRWIGDGRPYGIRIDEHDVDIRMLDELGKVDINTAGPAVLQGLFIAAGVDAASATALADNVSESRDPAGAFNRQEGTQRYTNAGLSQGPRYVEFTTPDELQLVLGITPALYRKLEPVLTVWSRRSSPVPALAPALSLAALPGMDLATAERFVAMRMEGTAKSLPKVLSNGTAVGNLRGGNVKTIVATASDGQGTQARLSVTVRLERMRGRASYSILRWQEDTE